MALCYVLFRAKYSNLHMEISQRCHRMVNMASRSSGEQEYMNPLLKWLMKCCENKTFVVCPQPAKVQNNQIATGSKYFKLTNMEELSSSQIQEMIEMCENMLIRSYCVYSKFAVASVLVTDSGKIFTGCNVENASYGLCICAERTAAVKAVSEGYRKFKYCFVLTKSPDKIAPCGACRQFLAEFGLDLTLFLVGSDRSYVKHQLKDLLPLAFTPSDLKSGVQA